MSAPSKASDADLQTPATLQIRMFGPLMVRVEGVPLPPLRVRKDVWLLALLILRNESPVDRLWLATTLWPDSADAVARKNLRSSLHELRRALGSQGYRLHSPAPGSLSLDLTNAEVDLLTFDAALAKGNALEQAVRLYNGPLLEGCTEAWVVLERARRQQTYLEALEALAELLSKAGETGRAIHHLSLCISVDPLRETAQCALMAALATAGDYAGAMQTYREFRLLLHEQLQTPPAASTTALYQQIRMRGQQEADRCAARPSIPVAPPSPLAPMEAITAPAVSNNLPSPLTSFIGREKEMGRIKHLLEKTRLLTLTGSGGCGKTRLALLVASEVQEAYPEGVWLVELASLSALSLVLQAVASVFHVREQSSTHLLEALIDRLKNKRLLLVLDNCEHMLSACTDLALALLCSCPDIRLLITSRERLGMAGEQTYRVPSLSLPDLKVPVTVERASKCEAARLFLERALLVNPDFAICDENVAAVAHICHRLDGIPLAIELAAARMRSLSVEEIRDRLVNRFQLLTGGDRASLPRHQTLRALINWSYDLLSAPEQSLLQRLSVFSGGWTLAAVEHVCCADEAIGNRQWAVGNATEASPLLTDEVLDLLTSLVDKSLVIAETQGEATRYRLLETMRQYAHDRLVESGESQPVRRRHRDTFLMLAEEAEPKLNSSEQAHWLAALETEHGNLRQALMLCQEETEGGEAGLRLGAALGLFWWMRGHWSEARERLAAVLSHPGAQEYTKARANALNGAGNLARMQGDFAAARTLHEESLTIQRDIGDRGGGAASLNYLGNVAFHQGDTTTAYSLYEESLTIKRELGDKRGMSDALHNLGTVAFHQGDTASARSLFEESLAIDRELGDKGGIAASLNYLGTVAFHQGDTATAYSLYEESLAISQELGDKRGIAGSLNGLGTVAFHQGDTATAYSLYEESLAISQELGDKRYVAYALEAFASLACKEEREERSARLWGAAAALRQAIGSPIPPHERENQMRKVTAVRETLGEAAFVVAWEQGSALSWEQAVASALIIEQRIDHNP